MQRRVTVLHHNSHRLRMRISRMLKIRSSIVKKITDKMKIFDANVLLQSVIVTIAIVILVSLILLLCNVLCNAACLAKYGRNMEENSIVMSAEPTMAC